MGTARTRHTSLRNRCFAFTAALLVLFSITFIITVNVLQTAVTTLQSNQEEHTEELAPIFTLEQLLYRTELALYHYMTSERLEEARRFRRFGDEVDKAFARLVQAPFGIDEERRTIRLAQNEWRKGYALSRQLIASKSQDSFVDKRSLNEFRTRLNSMAELLAATRITALLEVEERIVATEDAVQVARKVMFVTIAATLVLSFFMGGTLLYSVFGRIGRLEAGARRLAKGDLSTRVDVRGSDELGRLGVTLNTMAKRLQQAQEELQRQATRDGLTGLTNHAEFQRLLKEEMARSRRYNHPLSLLLLDVDNFKAINDRYGHLCGDRVLRRLAAVLQHESRPADHVARYGGEEFVVILPEIEHGGAMVSAERIRRAVARQSVSLKTGEKVSTTVSIGVATYPAHADSVETLIQRADAAMYLAKHAGRNLCISAGLKL